MRTCARCISISLHFNSLSIRNYFLQVSFSDNSVRSRFCFLKKPNETSLYQLEWQRSHKRRSIDVNSINGNVFADLLGNISNASISESNYDNNNNKKKKKKKKKKKQSMLFQHYKREKKKNPIKDRERKRT